MNMLTYLLFQAVLLSYHIAYTPNKIQNSLLCNTQEIYTDIPVSSPLQQVLITQEKNYTITTIML